MASLPGGLRLCGRPVGQHDSSVKFAPDLICRKFLSSGGQGKGGQVRSGRDAMDTISLHAQILARELLQTLSVLQGQIADAAGQRVVGWGGRVRRSEFGGSAANMAVWLALRRHDLTA